MDDQKAKDASSPTADIPGPPSKAAPGTAETQNQTTNAGEPVNPDITQSAHEQSRFSRFLVMVTSRQPAFWQAICAVFQAVCAMALVANAIIQYPITSGQLTNATKATEIARTSLESVQRAFIVPSTPTQGPNSHFSLVWTNQGNTTARGVQYRLNSKLTNSVLPEDFPFFDEGDGTIGRLVLAPRNGDTAVAPERITPQDLDDVMNEKRFLYVWGWVRYRDLFAETKEHITMTCYRITIQGQPLLQGTGGMTTFIGNSSCDRNNRHRCADEECNGQTYGDGLTWPSEESKH
ncbi:MAG: hypothetical protein ABIR70_08280 [Bryobacteraceae bacterium]